MDSLNKNLFGLEKKNERAVRLVPFVFYFLFGILLIVLDQWIKYLVFETSWGGFLNISQLGLAKQLFKNNRFAFSWPVPVAVIYLFYALVLFFVIRYLLKYFSSLSIVNRIAWTLILAGAISNIAERISFGYVRDFIYFYHGIFNLADIYICLGIAILLIISFSGDIKRIDKNDKIEQK